MINALAPLLDVRDLSCERDDHVLFGGLSFHCRPGDLVQITGPNGAGKTTLLRILAGINSDFAGQLFYAGKPLTDVKWEFASDLLYLGHLPGVKKALTPAENLSWYQAQTAGAISSLISPPITSAVTPNVVSIGAALDTLGLTGYQDIPCAQLSAGQLRRVALARLYLSQARIWILDEPFTAIDKRGVDELEMLIARHCEQGGIVILSSHQDLKLPRLRIVDLVDFQLDSASSRSRS